MDQSLKTEPEILFIPTVGSEEELARDAYLASLADPSPSGRLVAELALKRAPDVVVPDDCRLVQQSTSEDVDQSADLICGVDLSNRMIRKGSMRSIEAWLGDAQGYLDGRVRKIVSQVLLRGGVAIVVADDSSDLGVVCLKGAF